MTIKCECNKNEASIFFRSIINGQLEEKYLCEHCHSELNLPDHMLQIGLGGDEEVLSGLISDIQDTIEGRTSKEKNKTDDRISETKASKNKNKGGILDQIAKNLNDLAIEGKIDPVIGRDKEIDQVIEVLLRRGKNNPILIGKGGVGKTAIAEGLALRLIENDVPEKLRGYEIYSLDVSRITEGTGIHGSLEGKLHRIIAEAQERNVILFIDEIHQLVGTGSHGGTMDIGNMLKPALARGDLQVFGATTLNEYRIIEKDPALERRFQPIQVFEPSERDAVLILKGLQSRFEEHHGVAYTEESLEAAVRLSKRYIPDRQLPDKAIDLINAAGARINLRNFVEGERELISLKKEKDSVIEIQDFEMAKILRKKEIDLEKKLESKGNSTEVTVDLIEEIVEDMTRIPVKKLQANEQEKVKNLQSILLQKVIGQIAAVEKVAKAVRRARAGLKNKNKPVASFLFFGPTGVGKTELARSLAETMFGSKENLISIDMSEYSEQHTVSKLIGSPPGYIGHEEAGQLTEKIRRNPYSVVLVDEIDKAHPLVLNTFLQALEEGRMTDAKGRVVSFKETIVIMTTNAGAHRDEKPAVGFTKLEPEAMKEIAALKGYFKPEFLNRFDSVIRFNELLETDMLAILDIMLEEVKDMLKEQGKSMEVTPAAKEQLVKIGFDPKFGARPLRRVIQEKVIDGIADVLLETEETVGLIVDLNEKKEIIVN